MRAIFQILLFAAVPALASFVWHASTGRLPDLEPRVPRVQSTVAAEGGPVLWIDARAEADHDEDHVSGALPLRETEWSQLLPAILDRWQPGMRVVVYCGGRSCETSEAVAQRLIRETGWKDVFVLEGGWEAWREKHPQ